MAIFEDQLKLLQERNKLFTKESNLRKQTKAEEMSDTKAAQTGPVAFIRGMEQAEARQRAKAARAKTGDDREVLLENLQAENDYLRSMETQLQKQQAAIETRQQVASAGAAALLEYSSGGKSLEDVNRALTAALGSEGAFAQYDPNNMHVYAFNPDGQLSVTANLKQLLTAAGYDKSKIGGLIAQISGTAGPIAMAEGQIAGQESLAEARTVAEGVGGGIGDVRVGVGLDRPVERTQEIPFTEGAVPQAIIARSEGLIQSPYQLQRLNEQELPMYRESLKKANEQATNSAGVAANMQNVLNILDDPANKGKSLSGFGQGVSNLVKNIASELELGDIKPNTSSQQIQALITDAAVGRMKDLGGNDSQQELERIESIAGTLSDPEEVLRSKATAVRGAATKLALKSDFLSNYTEQNPALINRAESAYSRAVRAIDPRQPAAQIEKQMADFLDPDFKPALNESGFMKTTTSKQEPTTEPTSNVVDWNSL